MEALPLVVQAVQAVAVEAAEEEVVEAVEVMALIIVVEEVAGAARIMANQHKMATGPLQAEQGCPVMTEQPD